MMKRYVGFAALAFVTACGSPEEGPDASLQNVSTEFDEEASREASLEAIRGGFEAFKASVYKEPFEGGGYIVNGDIHLATDAQLLKFYETEIVESAAPEEVEKTPASVEDFAADSRAFTVATVNGYDDLWPQTQSQNLTYCVSRSFGRDYSRVVEAMELAAQAWEAAAAIKLAHLSQHDDTCNRATNSVTFDVRPVNVGGQYLARAFFPSYARGSRNVLIDASAMSHPNEGPGLTLTGILRHELGHVLGARHEHVRPEAGACFEDNDWRPVTNYDPFSVMHYPQCNGLGDWTLRLTELDKNGVACAYSPAQGFDHDPSRCEAILPRRPY